MIRLLLQWNSMRIACPSCAAEYEVPISRLTAGKLVRCARCGTQWSPVHAAEEVVPPEVSAEEPAPDTQPPMGASLPEVTAMDRLAAASVPLPGRGRLIGAWVLTLIVLAGAVAAAVGWRDAIVRAWPPSGHLLTATGDAAPQPARTAAKKTE
jgi:predicted Zn finger-like uncharacterized protein